MSELPDLEEWRALAFELCRRRGWSLDRKARTYYHLLEVSELQEALRGKRGDPVEEAGDLLFTALTMIPPEISLAEVLERNIRKIQRLSSAPPYKGEDKENDA